MDDEFGIDLRGVPIEHGTSMFDAYGDWARQRELRDRDWLLSTILGTTPGVCVDTDTAAGAHAWRRFDMTAATAKRVPLGIHCIDHFALDAPSRQMRVVC